MLIMGIGNVLMQDDGIGVYLAEDLMAENNDKRIKFVIGETDVDYCLAEAEDGEFLIILDAVQMGSKKGSIYEMPLTQLTMMEKGIAAHNFHLFHALSLKKGLLIGVEPYEINFHFGLSEDLKRNYSIIKQKVKERILMAASQKFG
ncbi:hydrogenase maturation protease [Heyndrickxia sp. MSNUG]|uniref:hydrogenase maturation protease n=1 Tax=Heyndrickxia sp. MSNUG TaxID=3136677 RepID=UPI003C2ABE76